MDAIIDILRQHGFSGNRCEAIALVNEMRNWALDCEWTESPDDILDMSDMAIVIGVNNRWVGGVTNFIECN